MKRTLIVLLLPLLAWLGCSSDKDEPDANQNGKLSSGGSSAGSSANAGSGGSSAGSSGQGSSQAGASASAAGSAGAVSCETAPVQPTEPCSNCVPFDGSYVDLVNKCRIQGVVACFSETVGGSGEMPACLGVMQGGHLTGCLCRSYGMTAPPGSGLVPVEDPKKDCWMDETLPACK